MSRNFFPIKRVLLCLFLSWAGLGLLPETGRAEEVGLSAFTEIQKIAADRFSGDWRVLTYGTVQEPAPSTQNPGNNFLTLPRYTGTLEIRPDLRLNLETIDLSAKPRLKLDYSSFQEGSRQGQPEGTQEGYINEWLFRWKAGPTLFISYGRENLQWGPSFLFSPSNPFFQDNGRRNPYLEVPGMDFARLIWIPDEAWTISLIVNTDEGRQKITGPDPFKKTGALKIDYTGRENYGSLILSSDQASGKAAGFFGGWTISDALLLYGEGIIRQGSRALYPLVDNSPFGISLEKNQGDDSGVKPVVLLGGSYTFETKGTLTLEYAYHGPGYGEVEADRFISLRRQASQVLGSGGRISAWGQKTLGQTANTGLRFFRKNYALLQYTRNAIYNRVDLTLRWTRNLDDGSCQSTALVTYSLGNHWELFSVGTSNFGSRDSEFRTFTDSQWMLGVQFTF